MRSRQTGGASCRLARLWSCAAAPCRREVRCSRPRPRPRQRAGAIGRSWSSPCMPVVRLGPAFQVVREAEVPRPRLVTSAILSSAMQAARSVLVLRSMNQSTASLRSRVGHDHSCNCPPVSGEPMHADESFGVLRERLPPLRQSRRVDLNCVTRGRRWRMGGGHQSRTESTPSISAARAVVRSRPASSWHEQLGYGRWDVPSPGGGSAALPDLGQAAEGPEPFSGRHHIRPPDRHAAVVAVLGGRGAASRMAHILRPSGALSVPTESTVANAATWPSTESFGAPGTWLRTATRIFCS